ncbi:lysozyme family protein [Novosphingobium terrae]|uniref:tail tape measure protein n=1 Tax=Novosphingobium terrae TaxID=2726189 RepID=UPI00198081E7|nr:tail tape measure protein [Novosphingobium terrae]
MATSRYTSTTSTTQSLMVEVRAVTQGFAQDLAAMRSSVDTSLIGGFTQAGSTLDTSLSNALKKGTSGFSDLREAGISALAAIAAQATGMLSTSGSATGITSLLSAVSGLPGRATGGPVSPGQAYLVGERGPEVFVPTAAGAIANTGNGGNGGNRTMNVAINVGSSAGADAPAALARSSRQIASALRRVMVQS